MSNQRRALRVLLAHANKEVMSKFPGSFLFLETSYCLRNEASFCRWSLFPSIFVSMVTEISLKTHP